MKNIKESLKTKLKNLSREKGKVHQQTLIRYFQERLLFRLALSSYKKNFFLKGGALIYAVEKEQSRLTLDLDLLAHKIKADRDKMENIFKEICRQNYPEDGVEFDVENISSMEILEDGRYSGIRLKIPARLDTIKQPLQVDIGFGDAIVPGPIEMSYPTLLEMEEPRLFAYSLESLMAEKFEAMISLGEVNSRMKDFYDLYRILTSGKFDSQTLEKAIQETFRRRKTIISEGPAVFSINFYQESARNTQWKAYLKKAKLDEEISFEQVHRQITKSLQPIYQRMQTERP